MKKFLYYSLLLTAFFSCQRAEELDLDLPSGMASKTSDEENGVQLGAKIQNAYSLYYMRQAYDQLYPNGDGGTSLTAGPDRSLIQATHLYIRVRPVDTLQVSLLVDDSTIDVFPYPLDRELTGCGEYVPSTEEEGYVYAVVPVNWTGLSHLNYTVIDTCCIPEEGDDWLADVERQALQNAGFALYEESKVSGRPDGYIKVRNTVTENFEGVKGVKVVMNTLVRVRHAYTGENGHYSCNTKFYSNVNYTLSFTNHDNFMIWKNNLCLLPATLTLGVHTPHGYSYNMDTMSHGWQLSTVHNAAYIYWNTLCDRFGLDYPPKGMRLWLLPTTLFDWAATTPMWRHRAIDLISFSDFMDFLPYSALWVYSLITPDMIIYRTDRSTTDHYRTIFHELSHASHYVHAGAEYWNKLVWNTVIHGGYGDETTRPDFVGVGEMWAYYADTRMINTVFENMPSFPKPVSHRSEWFRPGILDTVVRFIPGMTPGIIFQCLTSTDSIHKTMKDEIKQRVDPVHHNSVDRWFAPVTGE